MAYQLHNVLSSLTRFEFGGCQSTIKIGKEPPLWLRLDGVFWDHGSISRTHLRTSTVSSFTFTFCTSQVPLLDLWWPLARQTIRGESVSPNGCQFIVQRGLYGNVLLLSSPNVKRLTDGGAQKVPSGIELVGILISVMTSDSSVPCLIKEMELIKWKSWTCIKDPLALMTWAQMSVVTTLFKSLP